MKSTTHHFRIGLFVLTGATLFVAALFAMGLKSYFGERDVFETCVPGKVDTLSVGALVKLRGVTIGKVTSIEFVRSEYPEYKEQSVLIVFEVPKGEAWAGAANSMQDALNQEIAHGLRARVQGQGFLGASIVALEYVDPKLYPVEPIPWTPKHTYIPSAPSQINRVMASLEKSLRHVEDLDLAELLERVQKLIDTASHLAGNIDRVDFNVISSNAVDLITDLRATNVKLQHTLGDAQTAITGADVPAIARDTAALEAKFAAAADQLRHMLGSVDTGELNGSLANIRTATDELIVLLHAIEQRPSSVLFSKSPQPVPEMEKPPKK